MARNRRTFTKEFKLGILAEMTPARRSPKWLVSTASIPKPCACGGAKTQLRDRAFAGHGNAYTDEARVAELERTIGQLAREPLFKNSNATLKELDRKSDGRR